MSPKRPSEHDFRYLGQLRSVLLNGGVLTEAQRAEYDALKARIDAYEAWRDAYTGTKRRAVAS